MKKYLILCALLTSITSFTLSSQPCPIPKTLNTADAVGTWKGTMSLNGELKPFTLKISMKGPDVVTSLLIPSVTKKSIQTETSICSSEEFHISFEMNDRQYELRGKPQEGEMSGRLVQVDDTKNQDKELFILKKT